MIRLFVLLAAASVCSICGERDVAAVLCCLAVAAAMAAEARSSKEKQ